MPNQHFEDSSVHISCFHGLHSQQSLACRISILQKLWSKHAESPLEASDSLFSSVCVVYPWSCSNSLTADLSPLRCCVTQGMILSIRHASRFWIQFIFITFLVFHVVLRGRSLLLQTSCILKNLVSFLLESNFPEQRNSAGQIRPLPPKVYPIKDAVNALRHLAAARHIGKVVLDVSSSSMTFSGVSRPKGRWVISGGLGALGAMSGWSLRIS